MRDRSDPWAGILDEGETILWQGRPDATLRLGVANWAGAAFGLVFAGFALLWMALAATAGGFFWTFGLIHFTVGLGIVAGALFWPGFRRRHTWYTLTDRRAFIATDLPLQGKRLDSYRIDDDTALSLQEGDPPSLHFAHEYRRTKNGQRRVEIGFERIHDAREVMRLMHGIQRDADRSRGG
ncbi:aspartate carbamoyltransferase catalytic subunit [Roseovarius sp. SCSIO 43702]|uniref:aspartate carbamoyltransferase catalytic subunit n=1 Tax=Roseovarius sp. SCSIO 43702 TaxID=2823043 RepID=UPI001C737AAB|nr:aspartate carbamoyltransferase catalytic subunit [Roseovarius sp. SCSIO 43702]QYX57459.1 aspartate carbamoyltransferase catalytic subunit [Roseovarius sp. SCSIO 43702]